MFQKLIAPVSEYEITKNWKYTDKTYVSILCPTYNQEEFIEDTISSLLAQVSEYKFEIIVQDDCSIDNTSKILKRFEELYPNVFSVVTPNTNLYSEYISLVWKNLANKINGEYVAICEGDDFWCDSNKIQLQIKEHLSNSKLELTYTDAYRLNNESKEIYHVPGIVDSYHFKHGPFFEKRVMTLTAMFKASSFKSFFEDIPEFVMKSWKLTDLPLWLYLEGIGESKCIKSKTSVYRVLSESASRSNNTSRITEFNYSVLQIKLYFSVNYNKSLYLTILLLIKNYKTIVKYFRRKSFK